eukprot:IDg10273t1
MRGVGAKTHGRGCSISVGGCGLLDDDRLALVRQAAERVGELTHDVHHGVAVDVLAEGERRVICARPRLAGRAHMTQAFVGVRARPGVALRSEQLSLCKYAQARRHESKRVCGVSPSSSWSRSPAVSACAAGLSVAATGLSVTATGLSVCATALSACATALWPACAAQSATSAAANRRNAGARIARRERRRSVGSKVGSASRWAVPWRGSRARMRTPPYVAVLDGSEDARHAGLRRHAHGLRRGTDRAHALGRRVRMQVHAASLDRGTTPRRPTAASWWTHSDVMAAGFQRPLRARRAPLGLSSRIMGVLSDARTCGEHMRRCVLANGGLFARRTARSRRSLAERMTRIARPTLRTKRCGGMCPDDAALRRTGELSPQAPAAAVIAEHQNRQPVKLCAAKAVAAHASTNFLLTSAHRLSLSVQSFNQLLQPVQVQHNCRAPPANGRNRTLAAYAKK